MIWMVSSDQLTTRDAAKLLGYTVQHVRRLIREGRILGTRLGRDWLVDRESVRRYLANQETLDLPIEH